MDDFNQKNFLILSSLIGDLLLIDFLPVLVLLSFCSIYCFGYEMSVCAAKDIYFLPPCSAAVPLCHQQKAGFFYDVVLMAVEASS